VGTVLSYIFYWIAVIGALIYLKFAEVSFSRKILFFFKKKCSSFNKGRTSLAGMQSATAKKREERRTQKAIEQNREKEEYETDGINNALPRVIYRG